ALTMSPLYGINLDLGHYCASGFDPLPFIRKHHERISNLHLKDRVKNDGPNQPFGLGDTPIKAVLQLNKTERYRIPCTIEYEYAGTEDAVEELAKCLAYVKGALA